MIEYIRLAISCLALAVSCYAVARTRKLTRRIHTPGRWVEIPPIDPPFDTTSGKLSEKRTEARP